MIDASVVRVHYFGRASDGGKIAPACSFGRRRSFGVMNATKILGATIATLSGATRSAIAGLPTRLVWGKAPTSRALG
jgi:hypothetical protein